MLTLRRNSEMQGSEMRSSHSVEQTRLLRFGFEMRVLCLCWEETRTSHCWLSRLSGDTWEMRTLWISHSVVETRVSCLWEETRTSRYWLLRLPSDNWETRTSWASRSDLKTWSDVSEKRGGPRVAGHRVCEVKPQKHEPLELCVLVFKCRLRASNAVQKRRKPEPRVLT